MDVSEITAEEPGGSPPPELPCDEPDAAILAPERAAVREELDAVAAEIRSLRDGPLSRGAGSAEAAARLRRLEIDLLRLARRAAECEPEAPLRGHPLLSVAERWLAATASHAPVAEEGQAFTQRCLRDDLEVWENAVLPLVEGGEAGLLFDALLQTTALELDLESVAHDEECRRRLGQLREKLRAALAHAVQAQPPADETRDRWTGDLADRTETMLTAVDDLPQREGELHLGRVEDDLSWHIATIEPSGPRKRRLARKRRQVRSDRQDRGLAARLDRIFGARNVAWFERLILFLIVFVLGLLLVEMIFTVPPRVQMWMNVADACACGVFLLEFFVKLSLVQGRGRWFLRNFVIDLIPSIPFGLLLSADVLDLLRSLRGLRLLRLARLARFLRFLRPALRLLRVYGFLARGFDRLAQRYGRLLNRNIILYPTRQERLAARLRQDSLVRRARRLRTEVDSLWSGLWAGAAADQRQSIAFTRLAGWEEARTAGLARRAHEGKASAGLTASLSREIPAEAFFRNLASVTPNDIEQDLGRELCSRLARIVRLLASAPACWLPVVRRYVPRITTAMTDPQLVAAAARSLASGLKQYHERYFWMADLYGTVSPSQFIDRLGTVMVKASFRPAYRLALFGGVLVLIQLLLWLLRVEFLEGVQRFLSGVVGTFVMVLGSICIVILGAGWWLKRLAREATEYFERVANAQFLPLTETIRSRKTPRAIDALYRRVLAPEWRLREPDAPPQRMQEHLENFRLRVRSSLLGTMDEDDGSAALVPFDMLDRVVLLYRDALDGALFADNDTRTTSQLLGNPALQQLITLSDRVTRKERKSLEFLDLERQQSLLGGPYLWFNIISRSITHSVACLLVHYNRRAIPLAELPLASPAERERYEDWLASRRTPELAPSADGRYVTSAFTALHFLDFDPQRDREVAERFGPEVLKKLRFDRALMIRRVFGTYPLHKLPKDRRVLNLYTTYRAWLSSGRALLLPFFLFGRTLRSFWRFLCWIKSAIREVKNPELRVDYTSAAEADFATAARKIDRMRGPIVEALVNLRAVFDPEYLGVPLPFRPAAAAAEAPFESDLRFLDAEPSLMESTRHQARRASADMRRLSVLIDEGLLSRLAEELGVPASAVSTPEHLRALACAYLADFRGLRRLLSCREILNEVYAGAAGEQLVAPAPLPRLALRRALGRYWKLHGQGSAEARRAAWRATIHNFDGVRSALVVWSRLGESAFAEGCRVLADLLRHPARITEQIVTLRTVQTLSLLDVLDYREHVYELGRYADCGDEAGDWLAWSYDNTFAYTTFPSPGP
ncbi:MAG: ion transporter [Planctomycetia bacterium]|nr:ion transporter [Planctomycetia bacterium]